MSNVSHELRTPLANTKLYLRLLVSGKPDKREDYLQTLHREVGRLERMIEDLLDLSRLDQDAVPVQLVRLDLTQLLTQLVADRSPLANQRGLSLSYQANGRPSSIFADPTLLTQVVSNLIANAINYTPRGGAITLHTAVHQQAAQTWTALTVCDSGPGISAADLPHLSVRAARRRRAGISHEAVS